MQLLIFIALIANQRNCFNLIILPFSFFTTAFAIMVSSYHYNSKSTWKNTISVHLNLLTFSIVEIRYFATRGAYHVDFQTSTEMHD